MNDVTYHKEQSKNVFKHFCSLFQIVLDWRRQFLVPPLLLEEECKFVSMVTLIPSLSPGYWLQMPFRSPHLQMFKYLLSSRIAFHIIKPHPPVFLIYPWMPWTAEEQRKQLLSCVAMATVAAKVRAGDLFFFPNIFELIDAETRIRRATCHLYSYPLFENQQMLSFYMTFPS